MIPTLAFGREPGSVWWLSFQMLLFLIAFFVAVWPVSGVRHRALSTFLRLFLWCAVFAVFFRVSLVFSKKEIIKKPLAVVVDRSQSMTLPVNSKLSRWNEVRVALKDIPFWKKLQEDFDVKFYEFGKEMVPTSLESLSNSADPQDTETRIVDTLRSIGDVEPIQGILLMTDGVDTDTTKINSVTGNATATVPVFVAHSSLSDEFKDVAITSVTLPDTGFYKTKISGQVDVEAIHLDKRNLRMRVSMGDRVVSEEPISVSNFRGDKATVPITFTPDAMGALAIKFEVTRLPLEATYDNNQKTLILEVIRERARVLHVAGSPTWDERFLREYLKENPNIDVVSFFILRTPRNNPDASERELSLIPFPYQDLFSKELANFDLVIFQNFDFKSYFSSFYLDNLKSYVEKGGAFVMLGGDLSFGKGGYASTPVEEILPIRVRTDEGEVSTRPFVPVLTPEGAHHPIWGGKWSQADISSLSAFGGFQRAAELSPDSTVILGHPTEKLSGKMAPVLAARQIGKGRVVAAMVDSLWRWQFSPNPLGKRLYYDVWNGIYRWLLRDRGTSYMRWNLLAEPKAKEPGQLQIEIADRKYSPLKGVTPEVVLKSEKGIISTVPPRPTNAGGATVVNFGTTEKGVIEISAKVPGKEDEGYFIHDLILVGNDNKEFDRRGVDEDFLFKLAGQTGGDSFPIPTLSISKLSRLYDKAEYQLIGQREIVLWDHPLLLLFILLSASIEWWHRRRHGGA